MVKLSPAMEQYVQIKEENPHCLVMFRMGDFYEMFYEDAKTAARELDITLTARGKGESRAPLAGIPYHAIEQYIKKLVQKGYKIAMVEQLEDPKKAKGLVKRGLVRIITPGTLIEDSMLSKENNNYLAAVSPHDREFGIAFCDISTGEFMTTICDTEIKLFAELEKYRPSELILPLSFEKSLIANEISKRDYHASFEDDRHFWKVKAESTIKKHFGTEHLDGFGLQDKEVAIESSGALISYLYQNHINQSPNIKTIQTYSVESYMILDSPTQRNLELLRNIRDNSSRGTLFEVINKTRTSMGSRRLKSWLLRPLRDISAITSRHQAIEELHENALLVEDLKDALRDIADLERIVGRVAYGTVNPRDTISLATSLEKIPRLQKLLAETSDSFDFVKRLNPLENLYGLIVRAIKDEPAITIREGNIIRHGFNKELDELIAMSTKGKEWMLSFEEKEKDATGIKNLRVRYNKVFGYFIEISKSNLKFVPDHYIRKQTQVNCERFITEDLKEKESQLLGAQDKIYGLEYELFMEIVTEIAAHKAPILEVADAISDLDCLLALTSTAVENHYTRPRMSLGQELEIVDGRHPVVEQLERGSFIANDTTIGSSDIVHIITGPNMAGKSTYLRQVALITLLAQMGSFVPAKSATISIVDRIFSRVGAYDDLSMGQSTFMVEMSETANILNNATAKSLIIMDEVGRGTSTYDGLSLAWAIIEYILQHIKGKTLFATHYHHLNTLERQYEGVKNFNVLVEEHDEDVVFLHKIIEGGTDRSYGIHVAMIAGMPKQVIDRSRLIMGRIEGQEQLTRTITDGSNDLTDKNITAEDHITPEANITTASNSIKTSSRRDTKKKQKSLFEY
ncbi:DNA mismatch repair protein MutS [Candidatus Woesearchaeota archaeon]|nr:DNA mismatch repair protein MutS [Candidatus Woesearchaeota archaeon]